MVFLYFYQGERTGPAAYCTGLHGALVYFVHFTLEERSDEYCTSTSGPAQQAGPAGLSWAGSHFPHSYNTSLTQHTKFCCILVRLRFQIGDYIVLRKQKIVKI